MARSTATRDSGWSAGHKALAERIAEWIDGLADRAAAAEAIAALGEAAVPGLREYLRLGPEVIPQPRCFAVAMLARLRGEAATEALRVTLRGNGFHGLPPQLAESEYVVKNTAMEALAVRDYPLLADDVAFGIGERLRAAIVAAGRLRCASQAGVLLRLLDDDVLAESAADALAALGADAVSAAVQERVDAWLTEAELTARARLAAIRALRVLRAVHGALAEASLARALHAKHPAVRAAAALLAWPRRRDDAIIDPLMRGALGFDRALADDCRVALQADAVAAHAAAQAALRRNAEPGLYGSVRPLDAEQLRWLDEFIRAGSGS